MGLHLTFLDDEGFPVEGVQLGMGNHDALASAAEALGLPLFGRFSDYYGDVEIAVAEIPYLLRELETLAPAIQLAPHQRDAVLEILKTANAALAANRPFLAIAD
jgi:hypothetical protein